MDPQPPAAPPTLAAGQPIRWSNWYLTASKLAVGLLIALLIALLWLLRDNEIEEQRSTLIADVLWLEQSLRFHLEGNAQQLQQLALDIAHEEGRSQLFRTRGQHLIKTKAELIQLVWLDATGNSVDGLPTPDLPSAALSIFGGAQTNTALDLANKLGKSVYSQIYREQEQPQFDLYVPIYENRRLRGTLVGVYSLNALIKELVPWWFAEKYQLRVLDSNGEVLASNSHVRADVGTLSYEVPFDPPGDGLLLQVSVYRSAGSIAQTLIATLIVLLAGAVFWSLWAVRGLIARRIEAEQALRAEHAFRKAMEDSLTVGMRARDRSGQITYVNPAFCRMVGFSAEELIGQRSPNCYWAPEEMEKTQRLHDSVMEGRAPSEGFELRFMRKNGERFDALVYEAPLIDADGRHTGWMGSVLDVTERKRAEELARQQQEKLQFTARLVTMGEMASTLAHELNQPLAAIASYNTGCLNKLESGNFTREELIAALGKLGVQAQRAGRIIRQVHDFVRKSEPKRVPCDLAEIIDDSIGFIEPEARKRGIRIVREIQGMRPELMLDQVMLEQVLLNLMRNAIEAMSGIADLPAERRLLTVKLAQRDGQMEIRVIDRGPGIPAETQKKLFTPFFSTKPDGMGMGLNICRSIVEFHHGRLWIEDNPAGGSIFVITLPVRQP